MRKNSNVKYFLRKKNKVTRLLGVTIESVLQEASYALGNSDPDIVNDYLNKSCFTYLILEFRLTDEFGCCAPFGKQ